MGNSVSLCEEAVQHVEQPEVRSVGGNSCDW